MKSTDNRLIVFATLIEAKHALEALNAQNISDNFFFSDGGFITISGMGCLAATAAISACKEPISEVWNLGAVGALHDHFNLGDTFEISDVSKNPILPIGIDDHSSKLHRTLFPSLKVSENGLHLISSDYPCHHAEINQTLRAHGDLIDMEGYGIAYAARQRGVPVCMWKIVTDFATANGQKLILEQLDSVSQKIAQILIGKT